MADVIDFTDLHDLFITRAQARYGIEVDQTEMRWGIVREGRMCHTCLFFKLKPDMKVHGVCLKKRIFKDRKNTDWCWRWAPDLTKL